MAESTPAPVIEILLESWGLESLAPVFHQNEVDFDALMCMSNDDIKELVPTIGLRAKLKNKLSEYRQIYNISTTGLNLPNDEKEQSNLAERPVENATENAENAYPDADTSAKPFRSSTVVDKCFTKEDIKTILEGCIDGRHVLLAHAKNGCLDQKTRKILVHILVDVVLEKFNCSQVPGKVFENLASSVEELLLNEKKETYFIPGTGMFISKGKLVDRYRNKRRVLLESGAVVPKKKVKHTAVEVQTKFTEIHDFGVEDGLENFKSALSRLTFDDPDVEVLWQKSYSARKKIFFSSDKSCAEIFNEWPILKNCFGYKLIDQDYKQMMPNSENIYLKWSDFENAVYIFLKNCNLKDNAEQVLLLYDHPESSQDTKACVVLMLLSHICKPALIKIAGKKSWKPTLAECQEGFIYHVKIVGDVEKSVEERKKRAAKYGVTVQPYVILVAPTLCDIVTCYLVVDSVRYKIDNVLQAVDTCFKVFHVLNIEYPRECEQIWHFLQQAIYKIHVEKQKSVPRVTAMLSEVFKL